MLWGGWKERSKREHVGHDGKREERPLPYDVRFSGQICSVVFAKPADYLDIFGCCCEDNSIKGSRRNLIGFPFCFTDFLQFMFLELLSAILDNHVQSCRL